jgi:fatty-acyl-CoA synthase
MRVALSVLDFLDRAENVYGDRVAVIDEPGTAGSLGERTYRQIAASARGMAVALDDMGVSPGERVALVSPNAARFLTAFFGVSGYGRVLVPINFRLSAEEISYIVEHSGSTCLLIDPEYASALDTVRCKQTVVLDGEADTALFQELGPEARPLSTVDDEDATCSINYTSGTTARPKGVQLTHRNCWLNASIFGWHTSVSDHDVLLHTLPMFHCNGWGMPYAVTGMGGRHVVLRKVEGEEILSRIEREGVTLLCGAPAVVAAILDAADARLGRGESIPGAGSVRIVVAGAPPPSAIIEKIGRVLGWEFIQIYGLTETAPLLTVNRARSEWADTEPGERARLLSRAGVPAMGVQIKTDDKGEVLARSNHVFAGYWEQPEETAKAMPDGWFATGDGGYLDDAYLVIADRKKDVIITGGENVSSIEVEDCIYQHPDVAEVAVIGVPHEKWGETVIALVVCRENASLDGQAVIDFCREKMAHYKCPTSVEIRDSLPRTATGKLQKFKLRAPYWEGKDRLVN